MNVLEVRNLTKRYGDKAVVDNVSLTIKQGDIYGLIGQNGAGKTTFMRMVTSLSTPDAGEISLFGESSEAGLQEARRRMGAIIEEPALYTNLSATQNLEYYRIQRGIPDKSIVATSLEKVGLADAGKKKFKDFSMGMKQRLALALATMSKPDFIMLDEPINGLDPMGIVEIRELIKSLNESGVTFLLSSHILAELSQLATKYAFIHEGRLIKNLTAIELQEECKRALRLKVDDAPKAAALLETDLGIKDYKQVAADELRVYERLEQASDMVATLSVGGVAVSSANEVGDSLEDYFKNMIRENQKGGGA